VSVSGCPRAIQGVPRDFRVTLALAEFPLVARSEKQYTVFNGDFSAIRVAIQHRDARLCVKWDY